jgi:hypothetical protein
MNQGLFQAQNNFFPASQGQDSFLNQMSSTANNMGVQNMNVNMNFNVNLNVNVNSNGQISKSKNQA